MGTSILNVCRSTHGPRESSDPDAKVKFLAAGALRGFGGLALDALGNIIANGLGRRDYVTGEVWKNKPPFRHPTVLDQSRLRRDHLALQALPGRGMMKYYASGADPVKDMGVPITTVEQTHKGHYQATKNTVKDSDGGAFARLLERQVPGRAERVIRQARARSVVIISSQARPKSRSSST